MKRRIFHEPSELVNDVFKRIREAELQGEVIDYLTFVPDGEPTLDANLGKEIVMLRASGIKVAVITNASLMWMGDVQADLMEANWVSLKVDTITENIWRHINRPFASLNLSRIIRGSSQFRNMFRGTLATETMLVSGLNDSLEEIEKTAIYLREISPTFSYISIPTRPPSESWVRLPDESTVAAAYAIFEKHLDKVELLTQFEGTNISITGDPVEDLLAISSVHPLREDALEDMLRKTGLNWNTVESLVMEKELMAVDYNGFTYYVRKFR